MVSSSMLNQLIQSAMNEFASVEQPSEADAFLEFINVHYPSIKNIQLPQTSKGMTEKTAWSHEMLEENMYLSIRERMQVYWAHSDGSEVDEKLSIVEGNSAGGIDVEALLLGKYMAALSKETLENPSASDTAHSGSRATESSTLLPAYDGLVPLGCDGIHLSSCGHAVHLGCLDRYLSSLKERYIRRIVFEGGHIVDPDQGEFLCPVCRGLANSVLPAIPGDALKTLRNQAVLKDDNSYVNGLLTSSKVETSSLHLRGALALMRSAADVGRKTDIIKAFPVHHNGRIKLNLDSIIHVLYGMYFPGRQDKFSGSARLSDSLIVWDTLKYSLMSTEIGARCGRTSLAPNHGLTALYKELKSSSGFILSLLLKTVQIMRSKSSLSALQRLRGIQLFAESICFGSNPDQAPGRTGREGGNMLSILKNVEVDVPHSDIQFWKRASDPILAHDAFSSLMWVLYCLPSQFLSCEESFLSLVHIFYGVTIVQAIIRYCGKYLCRSTDLGYHDCLVTDIFKIIGEYGVAHQYFTTNYLDPSCDDIKDIIRSLSFPYLRRCLLFWKLVNTSTSTPFNEGPQAMEKLPQATEDMMECYHGILVEEDLLKLEPLENMFKIPSLDAVLKDEVLRSLVPKWLCHFNEKLEAHNVQCLLHLTPAVPFKLMHLPQVYQDLLQRYIKQRCTDCGVVLEGPALCLLCGKLCSPHRKPCCSLSGCQAHAMACGAGIGVFLLIRKTTVLLQRAARQAPWPSPYLDAFGEEDIEMHRGKPLYLNEERYAALTHMVASHGLDRSSKVLRQTTIGSLFML